MLQVPIYVSGCPWPPQEAEAEDPEIDVEAGPPGPPGPRPRPPKVAGCHGLGLVTFLLRRLGAQGDYKLLAY